MQASSHFPLILEACSRAEAVELKKAAAWSSPWRSAGIAWGEGIWQSASRMGGVTDGMSQDWWKICDLIWFLFWLWSWSCSFFVRRDPWGQNWSRWEHTEIRMEKKCNWETGSFSSSCFLVSSFYYLGGQFPFWTSDFLVFFHSFFSSNWFFPHVEGDEWWTKKKEGENYSF